MRLHPTRHLFRRQLLPRYSCIVFNHGVTPQRRSFFGFNKKPSEKEIKNPDLTPGLLDMLELTTRQKMNARPPPTDQLLSALKSLVQSKISKNQPMTNIEVNHSMRTFRYLRDTVKDDSWISVKDLLDIRNVVQWLHSADNLDLHREFAIELFEEIIKRVGTKSQHDKAVSRLILVLTRSGASTDARTHAEKLWESRDERDHDHCIVSWSHVFSGFVLENNEEELLRTFRLAELAGVPFTQKMHESMVEFYCRKNDVLAAKAWYDKKVSPRFPSKHTTFQYYYRILQFCLRNNEQDWCTTVFRSLIESNPNKSEWDAILLWAASTMGKGVEDLDQMMTVMVRRNPDSPSTRPNVKTINRLIEMANSRSDPYSAERYIELGKKWGITTNAKTHILQMDYRIGAGDLTGAEVSYNLLRSKEVPDGEDVAVINKYIEALCAAKTIKHDLINRLVEDIEERKLHLTGDAVTALCLMNLHRNELHDVVNILQAHAFHHGIDERAKTRESLAEYCFDRSNTIQQVWDAYNICRALFDEVNLEIRTRMMNEFFDRKRPDLATYVFGHMRQHQRPDMRPVLSTYIAVFAGFSRPGCAHAECVRTVHDMLKLDHRVEPDTKLYNSLMLAYTAVQAPSRALGFWEDITNSIEGPTYSSIEIVLRACEILPFGDQPAKDIWNKMRSMEIEITPAVFAAYVGALAGSSLREETKELIEGMQASVGFGPDVTTLATFYNALPGQDRKDEIEKWAEELYPDVWEKVRALGQYTEPEGERLFNLVRNTSP